MNRLLGLGMGLTVLGVVGYLVGIETTYPGRGFTVTAVMVGITLAIIGRTTPPEGSR